MDIFVLIITYSVLVFLGLSALGVGLVAASSWLVDNSAEPQAH